MVVFFILNFNLQISEATYSNSSILFSFILRKPRQFFVADREPQLVYGFQFLCCIVQIVSVTLSYKRLTNAKTIFLPFLDFKNNLY